MYSITSIAASGSTTSSSDPSRKTMACRTARNIGLTPSSGGMSGRTDAPLGTHSPGSSFSAMSAPSHSGNDGQLVAILDCRVQVVEEANVLVVEVDVDETLELALVEHALG